VKLFDNVYAVGNSETAVYALTSSEGIVLLDAGFENKAERCLFRSCKKWGSIPAKVKYILLGHGHADHFGGAKFFQDKYGRRLHHSRRLGFDQCPGSRRRQEERNRPKMSCLLKGNRSNSAISPSRRSKFRGTRPGSLAFIFPVKDKGPDSHGGIVWRHGADDRHSDNDALKQYTQSIGHYLDAAKR
jgi:metallo-beta-lactamase class B